MNTVDIFKIIIKKIKEFKGRYTSELHLNW